MKILILLLAVCLSCNSKEDEETRKAKELIEQTKKNYTADSLAIEDRRKLEEARIRDTLKR